MTTPVVERVRNLPLNDLPMAVDNDSGFPFDREVDRDDSFRSQLDDIAKRHPEFAEHLDRFPFRSDSLGRRTRPPRPSEDSSTEFRQRFGGSRPFGSGRFERFGFPFGRDPFEEEFATTTTASAQGEPPQPQEPVKPQEAQPQPSTAAAAAAEKKEQRGRRQNIQPSNTVDLGQPQEPVNDRNQRSMSAPPPDNRSGQQPRYVSSINIPINRDGGIGPQQGPVERVIPIHVEGRDEPVMPRNSGPQPERIFGQRPERFTQFVGGRNTPTPASSTPAPAPPQQPQEPQEEQQQKPQEPPAAKPSTSTTPIDLIQSIQKDVSELMGQVEKFDGVHRDKQYLYLDEMLTRNLIKLDNIDTQGQENIRQARKEAIKCIEKCICVLEAKAKAPEKMVVDDVEQKSETKEEEKVVRPSEEMEVAASVEPKQEEKSKVSQSGGEEAAAPPSTQAVANDNMAQEQIVEK